MVNVLPMGVGPALALSFHTKLPCPLACSLAVSNAACKARARKKHWRSSHGLWLRNLEKAVAVPNACCATLSAKLLECLFADHWSLIGSLGTTPIAGKTAPGAKRPFSELRGIPRSSSRSSKKQFSMRSPILGMASHDLSNAKTSEIPRRGRS